MRFEQVSAWLDWLETLHRRPIDLGLDRVASVAARLDLDFTHTQIVTVAGTNGKGSCVAALAALSQAAHLRVGCYTSPHLLLFNERIVIDGHRVQDADLLSAFDRVDRVRQAVSLTYFEFVTLAALVLFSRARLDVLLLEVGLGGRLDAVNIIDPDIAIITSIAIDHSDWLGSDREAIAAEKAGIIRAGKPVICGDPHPPLAIQQHASKKGAKLYQYGDHFHTIEAANNDWTWQGIDANGQHLTLGNLPQPLLPLSSVACAVQAAQLLAFEDRITYHCLATVALPGRFQCIKQGGFIVIFDVAHNPAAAAYLAAKLQRLPCAGRTYTLFGVMADKDYVGMIAAVEPYCDAWFIADLNDRPRAVAASELAAALHQQGIDRVHISKRCPQAYNKALSLMAPGDRLVVWGSFYWVAEAMRVRVRGQKARIEDSKKMNSKI